MSTWLLVWFVVLLVTTVAFGVLVAFLVRNAQLLGRTAKRFNEEAGPMMDDISRLGGQASERAARIQPPKRAGRQRDSG